MAATSAERIETLRERAQIEAGELELEDADANHPEDGYENTVSAPDAQVLVDFSDQLYLLSSEYSDYRHEKLLRHGVLMAERQGGLAEALEEKDAAEALVRHINQRFDNPETNRDYRVALRVIGKTVAGENGDPPDSMEWIPSSVPNTYDPSPNPSEMLDWEGDIQPMIERTSNAKEAAAIAIQFDAGLRGGEFKDLTTGQFTDAKHGMKLTVQGKQGQRTVTLIPSIPYVQRWLEDHPGDNDSDPLWCKTTDPSARVSDRTIYNWFERAAERADVSKDVTLTNFRKSSASFMASRGMSQAHLEERYGWVRGSKTASRYVSVFGKDSERETAKAWGVEIQEQDEPDPMNPIECPRCGKETPRDQDVCVWCTQALEPGIAQIMEEMEGKILDAMADTDDSDKRKALRKAYDQVSNDPDAMAEAISQYAAVED